MYPHVFVKTFDLLIGNLWCICERSGSLSKFCALVCCMAIPSNTWCTNNDILFSVKSSSADQVALSGLVLCQNCFVTQFPNNKTRAVTRPVSEHGHNNNITSCCEQQVSAFWDTSFSVNTTMVSEYWAAQIRRAVVVNSIVDWEVCRGTCIVDDNIICSCCLLGDARYPLIYALICFEWLPISITVYALQYFTRLLYTVI